MNMPDHLKKLFGWIKPKYNELTTYLTALTCILLVIVHPEFGPVYMDTLIQTFADSPGKAGAWFILFSVIAVWGFVLSIVHVFMKREKSAAEKTSMGAFAMGANGLAGIAAGIEVIPAQWSIWVLLPIWNILTGAILLYSIGLVGHDVVTDENASPQEVVIASLSLFIVFAIAHFGLQLSWAVTFSLCIGYSSMITSVIAALIFSRIFEDIKLGSFRISGR